MPEVQDLKDYTILLVEDDERLRMTIEDYLSEHDYKVITAFDGPGGLESFYSHEKEIDLILLDGMLPGLDGFDVLRRIREESFIPVIMLSARETEWDQLTGFDLGADVYLTKPFKLSVMKAQIHAILQRSQGHEQGIIRAGALSIHTDSRRVFLDVKVLETTPKEFDVLLFFMRNENLVLDRNTILDRVWGVDYFGDDRTVDTIVKQLRKKLTDRYPYIKSVYGVGYFFEV